jgi:hypothetical protein
MNTILAALIWGIVNAAMICKTSGNPFASHNAPWSN